MRVSLRTEQCLFDLILVWVEAFICEFFFVEVGPFLFRALCHGIDQCVLLNSICSWPLLFKVVTNDTFAVMWGHFNIVYPIELRTFYFNVVMVHARIWLASITIVPYSRSASEAWLERHALKVNVIPWSLFSAVLIWLFLIIDRIEIVLNYMSWEVFDLVYKELRHFSLKWEVKDAYRPWLITSHVIY